MSKEQTTQKISQFRTLLFMLIGLTLIIGGYFLYNHYYIGDYIIQRQWISSDDCDECLYIEFYEGCNRYLIYYFENEHELNPRFSFGDVVNINWREFKGKNYIKGITKAKKYRTEC